MTARMVIVFVALLVVVPAFAAPVLPATEPTPATSPSAAGQTGTVTGTDIYVRSGPGPTEYPVTKVHKPSTVTVVGVKGEYLEILPVPGTFSVISKKFVQADAAGASGTVNGDSVILHPGGDLRTSDFWMVHGPKLNKGDKVKIVGTMGDYYQIEPPAGAHFFIAAKYVDLGAGATGVSPLVARGSATSQPGVYSTQTVTINKTTRRTTSAPAPIPSSEMEAFKKLEDDLKTQFKERPADQIDAKGLMEKFLALNVTDNRLKDWVAYYVKYLQVMLDQKTNAANREVMVRETLKRTAEIDELYGKVVADKVEKPGMVRYLARGILTPSDMFTGKATGPKKFVMLDPITKRVDSYVQCTSDTVKFNNDEKKIDDFIGKEIGVFGKAQYDRDLKLDVVDVAEVVLLNEKGDFPVPARPIISGEPTPEPKVSAPIGTVKPVPPPTLPPAPKATDDSAAETKSPAAVTPSDTKSLDSMDSGKVDTSVITIPGTGAPAAPVVVPTPTPAVTPAPAAPRLKSLPPTSDASGEGATEG